MEECPKHPIYTIVSNEKDADALAWCFTDEKTMKKLPFKFPPLAPNEIRINVLYVGLCQSDVLTVRAKWGIPLYPIAPGHEIIGEVSLIGSQVENFKKGDIVGLGTRRFCCKECKNCLNSYEQMCIKVDERKTYGKYWGGYATQLQDPAEFFFKIPKDFKLNLGAPLFCAGATTFNPIQRFIINNEQFKNKKINTAVCGVGGLGHVAVQFLSKLNCNVTGLTSSMSKKDLILQLGANNVIDMNNPEEIKKHFDEFDFIINTLPVNKYFNELVSMCNYRGYVVQVGEVEIKESEYKFDMGQLINKEMHICGSLVGTRKLIKEMIDFCEKFNVYPMVEEFQFEDFPKAFNRIENERPKFRCVVNVKDFAEKNGWKK